jgi:hypothetical protein
LSTVKNLVARLGPPFQDAGEHESAGVPDHFAASTIFERLGAAPALLESDAFVQAATALSSQGLSLVNTWSRSRMYWAVLDGTPVTTEPAHHLRMCW